MIEHEPSMAPSAECALEYYIRNGRDANYIKGLPFYAIKDYPKWLDVFVGEPAAYALLEEKEIFFALTSDAFSNYSNETIIKGCILHLEAICAAQTPIGVSRAIELMLSIMGRTDDKGAAFLHGLKEEAKASLARHRDVIEKYVSPEQIYNYYPQMVLDALNKVQL